MAEALEHNERIIPGPPVTQQPDGPGLRVGKKGEISGIAKLLPGGAKIFRERLAQNQAEAPYWEARVGTVHDFKIFLLDNDTKLFFSIVYDGNFEPYLSDIFSKAGPWLDNIFGGVVDGYKGVSDPGIKEFLGPLLIQADFFYTHRPELSCHDIDRADRLAKAVDAFLEAAS